MASEEDLKKRVGRKLTKRKKVSRNPTIEIPDRFKDQDDAQDDVAAPKNSNAQYMNQSVFSMIAAAGSKADFHSRFDEDDDDDSSGSDGDGANSKKPPALGLLQTGQPQELSGSSLDKAVVESEFRKPMRKFSERKLSRSLPRLNLKTAVGKTKDVSSKEAASPDVESPVSETPRQLTPRKAPMMSRILEAEAQLRTASISDDTERAMMGESQTRSPRPASTTLAARLKEIFGYNDLEEVISEYPCWLLQSVLLQGYMYITQKHICFYAYLPKKSNLVARSGYLAKRGKQNPKYNRYWFALKGDVLSYYTDPADLYFPSGNIDLRYGISAHLSDNKEKNREIMHFSVTTNLRTYLFKADNSVSAKEWVKTLQKVIFRSHNDGDSVKICLPIENIIDIEESPVIEFAETFKIRCIDNDETYAIDEYFFSFFSFGRDALDLLRVMIDDTTVQKGHSGILTPTLENQTLISPRDGHQDLGNSGDFRSRSPSAGATPILKESVRATLSPSSPIFPGSKSSRNSGDWGRSSIDSHRKSVDLDRRSLDLKRNSAESSKATSRSNLDHMKDSKDTRTENAGVIYHRQKFPESKPQESMNSYEQSSEHSLDSLPCIHSETETQALGSQILDRSDLFHAPTIHQTKSPLEGTSGFGRASSEDSTYTNTMPAVIQVRPPTRAQTQRSRDGYESSHKRTDTSSGAEQYREQMQLSSSSPTLQQLVKAGSYPLQRAAGFAGYLRTRSKRMSNLLAAESMGYVEKVSGMWAGGRKHYGEDEEVVTDDQLEDPEDSEEAVSHGDRFRAHFALPGSERLQATYFGFLHRVLPLYGKVYVSNRRFCFRSLLPGTRTKMVLPLKDIENVDKEKGFRFGYSGLVVVIRGHEELFFEFSQPEVRDDCAITLLQSIESIKFLQESGMLTQENIEDAEAAKIEHRMLQEARQDGHGEHDIVLPKSTEKAPNLGDAPPILFDDPRASILNFKPTESLRITCLTIGSRGDVQPYIALCKGLLAEGHRPKIATHSEFEPWIKKHGIEFANVEGDPAELMRICIENGMFTYSFLREASVKFRGWIDELLSSAWKACQKTDLLIESPSAMAGIHIAEALGVPYFRAFTMPWTRTRAYPHAFAVPEHKMGGAYNYITYVMFDNVFWKAIAGQVNRWRKKELGLHSTNLDKLQPNKVPFLYNFSPSVVVPPLDYSDWIRVTGYWFLDEAQDWTPPKELTDFIRQARADSKKIVYVGFGSIVVSDPVALTKTVVDSILKADVRCILSKGWSDRLGNKDASVPEVPLPPAIHQIKSAPHDWLFKQIDAAVHHGGAGTTGASLRAGLPTIVKPFFGDQFFFGSRLEDLGVGICMKKLNVSVFSRALWEATHSERMIIKARVLGEQIQNEDGIATAIQAIYRDLEYAKTLIKHRALAADGSVDNDVHGPANEESWTFIGDESDPELMKQIAAWQPMAHGFPGGKRMSASGDSMMVGRKGSDSAGRV